MTRRKSTFFYLYLWIFTHRALQGTTGATYRPHVYASQAKFYLQTRASYFRLEVCSMAFSTRFSGSLEAFTYISLRYIRFSEICLLIRLMPLFSFHCNKLFRRPQRRCWIFIKEIAHCSNRLRLRHFKWIRTNARAVKLQSNLDYPDYSIIRTFFSGPNFSMNIN